jgi:hypothetical protein
MNYAFCMSIESIVSEIDAEIARLVKVRALLATTGKAAKLAEGKAAKAVKAVKGPKAGKKRVLSPEARKRIADAQKKRWAKVRKEA